MAQVLKDEIRERILAAALDEFFQKDYKSATMRSIAGAAGVPAGLIYSYYENKTALFKAVLQPVCFDWRRVMAEPDPEHWQNHRLSAAEKRCLTQLLAHRRDFIIMLEKSRGTEYEGQKAEIIAVMEEHLGRQVGGQAVDGVLIHIVASSFVEGLLQIMYHYKNQEWAEEILGRLSKMCLTGISL